MNPDEPLDADKFQQAWQAEAAHARVTIDADLLRQEVERTQRRFRSTIFWRDVREAGISLLLIPIWFLMGAALSLPWTWYAMVPALIWVALFILVDRRRHPQRPSEPGEPLLYYVKESVAQVEHQIWLLSNVLWWYLLPFSLAILAFFLQVAWQSSRVWWEFAFGASVLILPVAALYGWVYRLNQRGVREQLEPRRQKLLKLIAALEDDTAGQDSCDLVEVVSALSASESSLGWAQNWNGIIPSWREASVIILATLGGAFGGFWIPLDEITPVLFRAVVGAVVTFEIALVWAWLRFRKRQKSSLATVWERPALPAGTPEKPLADKRVPFLPRAPALVILGLTLLVSILAFLAVFQFISHARSRSDPSAPSFNAEPQETAELEAWERVD